MGNYSGVFTNCVLYLNGISLSTPAIGPSGLSLTNSSVEVTGTNRFGITNSALTFNGASYLSLPDNDAWSFGSGDFMLAAWFKSTVNGAIQEICMQYNTTGNPNLIALEKHSSNVLCGYWCTAGTYQGGTISLSLTDTSNWHFAAGYRIGSSWRLFLDGTSSDSFTITTNPPDVSTSALGIGANVTSLVYYFTGSIGEVFIFKGSHCGPQVLYDLTKTRYLYPIIPNAEGRLIS